MRCAGLPGAGDGVTSFDVAARTPSTTVPVRSILAVTILSMLHLWLASGQTLSAFTHGKHDDQLYLSLAQHIAGGDWLGPFTNLTLAKGPFYPMWIAASFVLGVPLQLSHHLLYIAACVLTILALRPLVRSSAALVVVYAVLVFNPIMFGINRVLREGVYIPLILLLMACLIGLFIRRAGAWTSLAAWAGGTGLTLSGIWLAREEAVWVLPPVLFILAAAAFLEWRRGVNRLWQRCLLFVSPLAVLAASLGVVSGINLRYYGAFIVTDVATGDWLAAYGALSRVEHDVPQKYAVVPRNVRERIYRVSPAFAELRSAIEGDLGRAWMTHGCTMMPDTCGDITAGWFQWLLRDAVSAAGHYRSAPMALGYYRRLAGEVNAACDAGTLLCGPRRATMMPPWRREYGPLLLRSMVTGTMDVVRFRGISVYPLASHGDEGMLLPFRLMTRDRLAPTVDEVLLRVSGWGFSPGSDLFLTVQDATGKPVGATTTTSHLVSGDVFDHLVATEGRKFERARDSRFILWTPCLSRCILVIRASGPDRVLGTLPLDGSARWLLTPELRFHLESLSPSGPGSARYPVDAFKLDILSRLLWLYSLIGSALGIILIIGLGSAPIAIALGYRMEALVPLLMLVSAFLGRIGLIGIIEATAMPIRNAYYLGPAHALLLLAGLVVCLERGRGWNAMWGRGAAGEPIRVFRSRRTFLLTVSLSSFAVLASLVTWYVWPSRETRPPFPGVRFCCKDMNGDRKADILWRQGSGAVAAWFVSGTSVVGTGVLPDAVPTGATIAGVGDFNGDGKADILWQQGSGALSVWLLDGMSVIGREVLPTAAPAGWTLAGVGDFNGDGKADILWRQSSGAVGVWLLDGARIIGTGTLPGAPPADWTIAGVGDFNGDGKADILWRQASGVVSVWLLNGTNVIGTGALGTTQRDWTIVGTGDFNGDGKADILWRQSSGTVGMWLLNGTALSGSGLLPGGSLTDSTIVGIGDFNGDGKADILWRQPSGVISVWLLDGVSVVGTGTLIEKAPREWRVQ